MTDKYGNDEREVRFDQQQLESDVTAQDLADDPWGAEDEDDYAVPGEVTGGKDEEDRERKRRTRGAALRLSGTRAGGRGGRGGAGAAPMAPMGGAGGAGTTAAPVGTMPGAGGAGGAMPGGGAMMTGAPGAQAGAAQAAGVSQAGIGQAGMSQAGIGHAGLSQAGASQTSMAGLGASRGAATSAAYAPGYPGGGLAADGGVGVENEELAKALAAAGYGPHGDGGIAGPGGYSDLIDSDGDGIPDAPANGRNPSTGGSGGSGPGGVYAPGPIGGGTTPTPGLTVQPGATVLPGAPVPPGTVVQPGGPGTIGAPYTPGVGGTTPPPTTTPYPGSGPIAADDPGAGDFGTTDPVSPGTSGPGTGGWPGDDSGMNTTTPYSSGPIISQTTVPYTGTAGSSSSGGYTSPGTGYTGPQTASDYTSTSGTDFTVDNTQLDKYASQWDAFAAGTAPVEQSILNSPNPSTMFGVLTNVVSPYAGAVEKSADLAQQSGQDKLIVSDNVLATAKNFRDTEDQNSGTAKGVNG